MRFDFNFGNAHQVPDVDNDLGMPHQQRVQLGIALDGLGG